MLSKALMRMKISIESDGMDLNELDSDASSVVSRTQSFVVPETELSNISDTLNINREGAYEVFSSIIQKRISIMSTIARMAHKHKQYKIIQVASLVVLRYMGPI